jgi:hypothetical protein
MNVTARVATNPEHRINAPNAKPRVIKLYGIGAGGGVAAREIAEAGLPRVDVAIGSKNFVLAAPEYTRSECPFDIIVLTARAGDDLSFAPAIYDAGVRLSVSVISVFFQDERSSTSEQGLALLRASSDILVITSNQDYLAEMLTCLTE